MITPGFAPLTPFLLPSNVEVDFTLEGKRAEPTAVHTTGATPVRGFAFGTEQEGFILEYPARGRRDRTSGLSSTKPRGRCPASGKKEPLDSPPSPNQQLGGWTKFPGWLQPARGGALVLKAFKSISSDFVFYWNICCATGNPSRGDEDTVRIASLCIMCPF